MVQAVGFSNRKQIRHSDWRSAPVQIFALVGVNRRLVHQVAKIELARYDLYSAFIRTSLRAPGIPSLRKPGFLRGLFEKPRVERA
jgi:hypothetical protein